MGEFSVKFRGVRGSYPIASKDFLQYGGNTSCVEVNVNGNLIILDAGTGLINVGNELLGKYIASGIKASNRTPMKATVLISHIHQDHLQGFTFFRPLHVPSSQINVFGNVNYNDTFAKYEIDYAIVEDKEIINTYISADENYEKVFDDETFSIYMKK